MILVTGATGTVGREVVRQLVEAGQPVRALTRDPDKAPALGDGVELVAGDLGRPETLSTVLDGVQSVFLLSGGGPETPLHDANLGQAAAEAGVGHLVKLSIIGAEYGFTDLVSTWHLAGERAIQQIGARPGAPTWTFLRPGEFSSNARLWAGPVKAQGTVFWSEVDTEVAVVDPRDVAAAAVTTLLEPGHEGRTYRFGGPEPLTARQRVEKLGAALGRELKLVAIPIAAARDAAAKAGRQALVVETTLGNLTREEFRQQAKKVLPTFEKLVGRPPMSFDQWVTDNVDIFR